MKYVIAVTSLMISVSAFALDGACVPGFTGCFQFGAEAGCNPILTPPAINTCGFQFGGESPDTVSVSVPQATSQIGGTFLVQEQNAHCFFEADTINPQSGVAQPGLIVIQVKAAGVSICNPLADGCAATFPGPSTFTSIQADASDNAVMTVAATGAPTETCHLVRVH